MSSSFDCYCKYHTSTPLTNITSNSYCSYCGSILLYNTATGQLFSFIKPTSQQKQTSTSPLDILNIMLANNSLMKPQSQPISEWYIKRRKKVLYYLQSLTLKLKYSDTTFYTALLYIDNALKYLQGTKPLHSIDVDYITLAYFLIMGKANESNIFEPDLSQFISSNNKQQLDLNEVKHYEIKCLKDIDYNILHHSAFDWLCVLLNNGFITQNEFDRNKNNNSNISTIYQFAKKTLAGVTGKDMFIRYDPLIIAFSIVKYTRMYFGFIDNDVFDCLAKDVYQLDVSEYMKCYEDIDERLKKSKKKKTEGKVSPMVDQGKYVDNKAVVVPAKNSNTPNIDIMKINSKYKIECVDSNSSNSNNNNKKNTTLIKKNTLQNKSKFGSKEQDNNNNNSKSKVKCVYNSTEYNKNDNHTLLTNNHNQVIKCDNNTTRTKSVRQSTSSSNNRKIFKTVKMTTKIDFHNIKNINKTKNDFVNNVNRYSNSIVEGTNSTQSNNYAFNKSHKYTGSFIKAQMSSSSNKKVKLYLDTTTTTSSFVLTDNNNNNNIPANLKSKFRGTNAVKVSSFLRSEGRLPSIDKSQNK